MNDNEKNILKGLFVKVNDEHDKLIDNGMNDIPIVDEVFDEIFKAINKVDKDLEIGFGDE